MVGDDRAARLLNSSENLFDDREIHGRTHRVIAGRVLPDHRHFGVLQENLVGGSGVYNEVTLGSNVIDDPVLLLLPIDTDDEAEIEIGSSCGRDDVVGARARLPGGDAVDVQARQVQKIEKMSAAAIDMTE